MNPVQERDLRACLGSEREDEKMAEEKKEEKGILDEMKEEAEKKAWRLKKKGEEMAEVAVDKVMRQAGKTAGKFVYPETQKESFFLWSKTFLVCSRCRRKFGPVDEEKWKEQQLSIGTSSQLALGAVTGNPILITKGMASLVNERGGMAYLQSFQEDTKRTEVEGYMVQCEYCTHWFCSTCWNLEKNVCVDCAGKGLKSFLGSVKEQMEALEGGGGSGKE